MAESMIILNRPPNVIPDNGMHDFFKEVI